VKQGLSLLLMYEFLVFFHIYIVINCGDPGRPDNGNTIVTSTTVGSVVTHTCNDGFVLDGADQRECISAGMWSAPLPTCRSKSNNNLYYY